MLINTCSRTHSVINLTKANGLLPDAYITETLQDIRQILYSLRQFVAPARRVFQPVFFLIFRNSPLKWENVRTAGTSRMPG